MSDIAFTIDGRPVSWKQVLASTPDEPDRPVGEEEFRRRAGLISAADVLKWLDRWSIELTELRRWLAGEAVGPWVDAVCSGSLQRRASSLARDLVILSIGHQRNLSPNGRDLQRRAAAARRRLAAQIDPSLALASCQRHLLDWTQLKLEVVACPQASVARELRIQVRDDGCTLRAAARRAGLVTHRLAAEIGELPDPERVLLTSALPGEVVGPVGTDHRVVGVAARVPPVDVTARSVAQVLEDRIERESVARIRWVAS